jgi:glucose/arabinose dehydrogenase
MRMITILAAGAALALAMATGAQAQSTQAPAQAPADPPMQAPAQPPAAAPAEAGATSIKSVNVVDITELPADTQKQVNEVVTQRGDDNLQRLRSSIDGMPQLKSALEAKGVTSAQVIAASMSPDGALTLITKKDS